MSEVRVTVDGPSDYDADELAGLSSALRSELLELDVDAVEAVVGADAPEGAKGLPAWAATLTVRLGLASLGALVKRLRQWAGRTGHSVEVTIDGDSLKVTGASDEQQQKLIDAWLARHGSVIRP
jgi:hypothetical protein